MQWTGPLMEQPAAAVVGADAGCSGITAYSPWELGP